MAIVNRIRRDDNQREETRLLPPTIILHHVIIRGIKGGLIATAGMTLYRLPVFRALPPTAEFWARYVGSGDAEDYPLIGLILHFLYGAGGGGAFGVVFATLDRKTAFDRERFGLVSGLVYGLLLSVFGSRVLFPYLLDRELESDELLVFHVGHVIYGLTLGTWFGRHEGFGDVYE